MNLRLDQPTLERRTCQQIHCAMEEVPLQTVSEA